MTRRGMTLVEIITVSAVMLVLTGIVSAVYVTAKSRGKDAACISNLQQIGKALQLYAGDNDDRIPPFASYDPTLDRSMPNNFVPLHRAFGVYGVTENVWTCPLSHSGWTATFPAFQSDLAGFYGSTAFAIDSIFKRGRLEHYPKSLEVKALSSIDPSWSYLQEPCYALPDTSGPGAPDSVTPHGRNVGNRLFFDGHVELEHGVFN